MSAVGATPPRSEDLFNSLLEVVIAAQKDESGNEAAEAHLITRMLEILKKLMEEMQEINASLSNMQSLDERVTKQDERVTKLDERIAKLEAIIEKVATDSERVTKLEATIERLTSAHRNFHQMILGGVVPNPTPLPPSPGTPKSTAVSKLPPPPSLLTPKPAATPKMPATAAGASSATKRKRDEKAESSESESSSSASSSSSLIRKNSKSTKNTTLSTDRTVSKIFKQKPKSPTTNLKITQNTNLSEKQKEAFAKQISTFLADKKQGVQSAELQHLCKLSKTQMYAVICYMKKNDQLVKKSGQ